MTRAFPREPIYWPNVVLVVGIVAYIAFLVSSAWFYCKVFLGWLLG